MRTYSKIAIQYWLGEMAAHIRSGPCPAEAHAVAFHLLSAPGHNMIGLYRLPLATIAADTGLTIDGASMGLRCLIDGGFVAVDERLQVVWVRLFLHHELGSEGRLKPGDKRRKPIIELAREFTKSSLYAEFFAFYEQRYAIGLPVPMGHRCPIDGASMGHPVDRPHEHEHEHEQEHQQECVRDRPPRERARSGERARGGEQERAHARAERTPARTDEVREGQARDGTSRGQPRNAQAWLASSPAHEAMRELNRAIALWAEMTGEEPVELSVDSRSTAGRRRLKAVREVTATLGVERGKRALRNLVLSGAHNGMKDGQLFLEPEYVARKPEAFLAFCPGGWEEFEKLGRQRIRRSPARASPEEAAILRELELISKTPELDPGGWRREKLSGELASLRGVG